jgi:D-alanine-D-alanine ligase
MADALILYNAPTLPAEHPEAAAEWDVLVTVRAVAAALRQAGHVVRELGVAHDPTPLVEVLKQQPPAVVFNLFEGTARHASTEATAAGLLEWFNVPYTGSPPAAMLVGLDKPRTKTLLRGANLPTAEFMVVERLPAPSWPGTWPALVKLSRTDASVGIDQTSVVRNQMDLEQRAAHLLATYHEPALVEPFLDGREFNVAVIGDTEPRVLPMAEIRFDRTRADWWPIVSYESKWSPGSAEDLASRPTCPAELDTNLREALENAALAAFRLIGLRDYARIDFRTDAQGRPFILEVNPNPDLAPEAGLARALRVAGIEYEAFVSDLVQTALARSVRPC